MAEMIPGGQGSIRIINVAAPGAGAEFTHIQDVATRWRLISVKARFVADATIVNRIIDLGFTIGVNVVLRLHLRESIQAGETRYLVWHVGGLNPVPTGGETVPGCLPERFLMNNQMVIGSITDGLQATDEFTLIYLWVEEWIEPLV